MYIITSKHNTLSRFGIFLKIILLFALACSDHRDMSSCFGATIPRGLSRPSLLSSATFLSATALCAITHKGQQQDAHISIIQGSSGRPIILLVFARLQAIMQHGPPTKNAGTQSPPQSFLSLMFVCEKKKEHRKNLSDQTPQKKKRERIQ